MSKVAIVTDSTAHIPENLLRNLDIEVAPLQVIWNNQIYRDGIDMQPSEFYERLKTTTVMPSTSQVTPAGFMEVYKKLLEQDFDILSIHISGKLSGTLDSAHQAREALHTNRIELVDSESAGMGLGFHALTVARAAKQGATLKECKALAEKARQHTSIFFVVDTLEFLRRGGRIGSAAALMGTVLNLKPILQLHDGVIEAVDKVRTTSKAMERVLDLVEKGLEKESGPIHLSTLHANAQPAAELLLERARQRLGATAVYESIVTDVSPAIGTHIGPGAVALLYLAGM
jgi:DegV family protein with EDD domain